MKLQMRPLMGRASSPSASVLLFKHVNDSRYFKICFTLALKITLGVASTSIIYTVSQKSDTGVAHYNFNAHQPILVILGRDVAERLCYRMVICYPTSPN